VREQFEAAKSQIQQVRNSTNIVELVSEFIPLKKVGTNFKGLCPFHKEKTPSFIVSQTKQIYHCFGCGEGGNAFDFLMKVQSLSFKEALERLAARAGIEIKRIRTDGRLKEELEKLFGINKTALEFFKKVLTGTKPGLPALKYLKDRGLSSRELDEFNLGFAPDTWDGLCRYLKNRSHDLKLAEKLGLVAERKSGKGFYDKFRNRIMFPIYNLERKIIGFGGRTLGKDEAKYINSSESELFSKRTSFYGIDSATAGIREEGSAIIVEGYMDLIALRKYGFKNSLATLGTAFTMEHGRVLKRFTDNIYVNFDSDEAGLNAVKRVLKPVLLNSLAAKVVLLPASYDPDTYLGKFGATGFKKLIEGAKDLLEFYVSNYFEEEVTHVGKARVLDEIKAALDQIPSQFERELATRKISELTGIKETTFREKESRRPGHLVVRGPAKKFPNEEMMIIKFMVEDPSVRKTARDESVLGLFVSDEIKALGDKVITLFQDRSDVDVNMLTEDLDDELLKKSFLEVLVKDSGFSPDQTRKAYRDCVKRIKNNFNKKLSKELQEKLVAAEKAGDKSRYMELLKQTNTLIKGKY
jgi:DNA primase